MRTVDSQIGFLNLFEIRNYGGLNPLANPTINPLNKYSKVTSNMYDSSSFWGSDILSELMFSFENLSDKNPINCIKIDNTNKRLISGSSTGNITVYDTATPNYSFLKKLSTHQSSVRSMSFTPIDINQSNNFLLSGDSSGNIIVWDNLNNLKYKSKLVNIHDQAITDISFSLSGTAFATSSEDKSCKLIDLSTEKVINTYIEHNSDVKSCDWAKQRAFFATSGKDKKIRFFDPHTKESVATMHDCHKDTINRIRFHSNSNYLLSGSKDHNIKLIDFRMLKVLQQFNNHASGVNSLSWNPQNSDSFCSVGEDGNIIFCEINCEDHIPIISAHDKEIFDLSYNSQGNMLVTGGKDCSIKIWSSK